MVTKKDVVGLLMVGMLLVGAFWLFKPVLAIDPTGADLVYNATERAPNDSAASLEAEAGNITRMDIRAYMVTQTWQGYVGNVSGTIMLADANDNVLYNWTLADPEGEIYAVRGTNVSWRNVQCFNFSASGDLDPTGEVPGEENQKGMNLTQLEALYNITWDDVDGVNETFYLYDQDGGSGGGAGEHDEFYTSNLRFTEGECPSTRVFGDSGAGVANEYEEVLLYDPTTNMPIFVALIEEDLAGTIDGFDGQDHDFEMLVLEDGHLTDTVTTTYWFYVELE